MRLYSLLVSGALTLSVFSQSTAQQINPKKLFAPFDCREHSEETAVAVVPAFSVQALPVPGFVVTAEPALVLDTADAWKQWSYVENFAFGKDRGGMQMITDLSALHPVFRDKILKLIALCQDKGIKLAVVESYRTHAKQHEYKTMGKKYTNSGAGKSKHQYGLAVDIVPIIDSKAMWDNTLLWRKVGVEGEKLGLRWGGRWKKPYDPGHFEWTGGLGTADLYQGSMPSVPAIDEHYPCLEEDITNLRKYWSEWELSQSTVSRK